MEIPDRFQPMNSSQLERNLNVYEDKDYLKGEKDISVWGADKFAFVD